jgi:hypothetical protein
LDEWYHSSPKKKDIYARCSWLTPVILSPQEAEIRKLKVQSQPRQIVHKTISRKPFAKKGWWSGSRYRP